MTATTLLAEVEMKIPGHLRIEEIRLAAGQEWTNTRQVWRFVRLSQGAAYWLEPARPRSVNEGELVVLGPEAKGFIRASQINDVLLHGFEFAPELLCGFFTLAEREFFLAGAGERLAKVHFLPSTHPAAERLRALAGHRDERRPLQQRIELLALVASFFDDQLAGYMPQAAREVTAQHRFQQIIAQMPDMELIHHNLSDLAALCGCSSRHFNRLFRIHFGVCLRARQTELRMLKASQLLAESNAKIIQIALESGYHSLSLFNALFKRRFGVSPSQWRATASPKNGSAPFGTGTPSPSIRKVNR